MQGSSASLWHRELAGNDCPARDRNLGLLRHEHQGSSVDRISARDGDCGGSDDRDYGGAAYCTEEVRLVLTAATKFAERKNRWERAAHTTYQRGESRRFRGPGPSWSPFLKSGHQNSRLLTIGRISPVRSDTGSDGILHAVRAVPRHFEPKRNTTPAEKRMLFWFPFGLQIFGVCVIR